MSFLEIVFYFFSTILVVSATLVVSVKNPVMSALSLVLAFFSAACIWMTLQAEFLAIVLVLVYVGAVMVLFLFVVMMLDINLAKLKAGFTKYLPIGLVVSALLIAQISFIFYSTFTAERFGAPTDHAVDYSNAKDLGVRIYTEYVYPFELAALLLLVAIVAAIALTMRKRPKNKYVDPAQQVSVRKEDRIKIVRMDSANSSREG